MIKYQENRNDIIQSVEIDLTEILTQSRQDLESKITKYLKHEGKSIFQFEAGKKLVYETEVLIPKINKDRLNVLMVLGNPAVHSVAEGMFFSYERRRRKENEETWIEHRFWRALRECEVLKFNRKFNRNIEKPTSENIGEINDYKRDCLLNGKYDSDFNIFLLPYFSFPTPASGECSGVNGIAKIVGKEIFKEMKKFEFGRFKRIILGYDIKNVICFEKTNVLKDIKEKAQANLFGHLLENNRGYSVYKIDDPLKDVILYYAGTTRLIHTSKGKKILKAILSDIRKRRIG